MLFGTAGSGKTCTMHVVLDEDPPEEYTSTPLAARPVKVYHIDMTPSQWKKLSRKEQDLVIAKACHSYDAYELADIPQISDEVTKIQQPQITSRSNTGSKKAQMKHSSTASEDGDGAKKSRGENAPVPPSLATYDGILSSMEECSKNDTITVIKRVQISDCGGQPQFHEILPIFVKGTTLYLFIFKLNEELSAHPLVKYYEDGKAICDAYPRAETNEQLLEHCLRVIRSQKATTDSEPPRIMIIGTHKDKEHECTKETREDKNAKLTKLLLPEFADEVEYYCSHTKPKQIPFPLNAKFPGEKERETAEYIRRLVSKCSASIAEIPLQWHGLEVLLEDMAKVLKRGILSIEECIAAAEDLHFDDEAAFKAALEYLDELNIVCYYPDVLPGVVFASAQVLLDKVTELVRAIHEERHGKKNRRGKMWRRFCDHALVSAKFLAQEEFQKHYKPGLFNHEHLMVLFKKLLIFAVFSETEVFVPALLRRLTKEEIDKHRVPCNLSAASPLVLTFPKHGGPLLGVFCASMVALLSEENTHPCPWKLAMDEDDITPCCLYRNCVRFTVHDYPGSVVLIDAFEHIEVHVDMDTTAPSIVKDFAQYCEAVKQGVIEAIRRATLALHYDYYKPTIGFGCPCDLPVFHLAKIRDDKASWICSNNRSKCGRLAENQKIWLKSDEEQRKMKPTDSSSNDSTSKQQKLDAAACTDSTSEENESLSLDSTPKLHQLVYLKRNDKIFRVIKRVAANWEDVALQLHFEGYDIDAIARDANHKTESACRTMFTKWLKGEGRKPTTWKTLITVLDEADLSVVAEELSGLLKIN